MRLHYRMDYGILTIRPTAAGWLLEDGRGLALDFGAGKLKLAMEYANAHFKSKNGEVRIYDEEENLSQLLHYGEQ